MTALPRKNLTTGCCDRCNTPLAWSGHNDDGALWRCWRCGVLYLHSLDHTPAEQRETDLLLAWLDSLERKAA